MKNNTFNYLRLKSLQKISKEKGYRLSETWDHFKVLDNVDYYLETISEAFQMQEDEIMKQKQLMHGMFFILLFNTIFALSFVVSVILKN